MQSPPEISLVERKYADVFAARLCTNFDNWIGESGKQGCAAALGFQRGGDTPFFLERYLDEPVEGLISKHLDRWVPRKAIVEIGNFAADRAMAMIQIWATAANDLGGTGEFAVATLTAPLRSMLRRIGVPIVALAPAQIDRAGSDGSDWGTYYDQAPQVCFGSIQQGQEAISKFLGKRRVRCAA